MADTWGNTSKEDKWDNTEADENFWGSDTLQTQCDWSTENKHSDWPGGTKDSDWSTENKHSDWSGGTKDSDWSTGNKDSDWPDRKKDSDWSINIQPGPSNETKYDSTAMFDWSVETKKYNLPKETSRFQENDHENCTGRQDSVSQSTYMNLASKELANNNSMSLDRRKSDTGTSGCTWTENGRFNTSPGYERNIEKDSNLCENSNVPYESTGYNIPQKYDPLSKKDEDGGNLFVIDDSDSDCEIKRKYSELPWQPVVKKDPYFVKEDLNLLLEEVRKIGGSYGNIFLCKT